MFSIFGNLHNMPFIFLKKILGKDFYFHKFSCIYEKKGFKYSNGYLHDMLAICMPAICMMAICMMAI